MVAGVPVPEVTARFIERARNFRPGTLKERLRVIVRGVSQEVVS